MANNCLVTKLKSVVDNDNLKVFNALKMYVNFPGGNLQQIPIKPNGEDVDLGGVGVSYKPLNNCHICNGIGNVIEVDGQYTLTGEEPFSVIVKPINASAPAEFLMIGLDKITHLVNFLNSFIYCDYVDDVKYIGNNLVIAPSLYVTAPRPVNNAQTIQDVSYIRYLGNKGTVTSLRYPALITPKFDLADIAGYTGLTVLDDINECTGNIGSIAGLTALTKIKADYNHMFAGDIASLGAMTSLVELYIPHSKINGTIESFVAAQVAAGRTSGVIKKFNANGLVTYGGNIVSVGHHSITWSGAGNITVGDEYID